MIAYNNLMAFYISQLVKQEEERRSDIKSDDNISCQVEETPEKNHPTHQYPKGDFLNSSLTPFIVIIILVIY